MRTRQEKEKLVYEFNTKHKYLKIIEITNPKSSVPEHPYYKIDFKRASVTNNADPEEFRKYLEETINFTKEINKDYLEVQKLNQ